MRAWTRAAVLFSSVLAMFAFAACSKTVEGETKAWEANQQKAAGLKALYPGFSAALDEQLKRAQTAMEAAKTATEEDKPKRMAEANALLSSGWVGDLQGLDGEIKELRGKITQATTGAKDETARLAVRQVADDAQRVIAQVEERLKQGAPDAAAAGAIVTKLDGDLEAAEKNVETVIKAQADAAKAAPPAAADGGTPAPAVGVDGGQPAQPGQPAPAATWKCAYCGGSNEATATKCQGCGAPKE
ncbi:MAG TPA: zinc finger Ran-binding domain-containing protein [Myxococcota bacterium]|nr:zinc finger Ran-binding domain-containing protein [Myxococcota bacterium]HRY92396.1 zinc finger Ran-binding domain-containing protein [Myxococcota bacterium]HSA22876.1 zinc finger Ran-binding domain-containing protein [Myxococcota bacterium]